MLRLNGNYEIQHPHHHQKVIQQSSMAQQELVSMEFHPINPSNSFSLDRGVKEIEKREHSIYRTGEEAEGETEEDATPKNTSLDILLPGSKLVDIFTLDLDSFDEWVIHIEASFKSPGTGKSLFKRHECCVYLIDQVC